jgi:urea transport system substrate-binding protein
MAVEKARRDVRVCLADEELQQLVAGHLAAGDVAIVILHAADCDGCAARLRDVGFDMAALLQRNAPSADTAHGVTGGAKQADTPTTTAATNDVWPEKSGPISTKYPFLAAPQTTDELGRLGPYRILRVLGEGGMGTVFEAEDSQLRRRVAIKVLRQGLDELIRQRFLQEAQVAASLSSDRIVTIHHIGEDRGCPYMVMELLEGESLDERMKRAGKLPLPDALRIAREAAEGLAVAHENGLIHRDIKPANVWLEIKKSDASSFRVKLLDFGIARSISADTHLTASGMIVGTPSYMCPEQAHSQPLDGRSDLFSLGVLIYAMLAGDSPFTRASTIQSIRAVVEEEALPIRHTLPHLPAPVGTLIQRLLSKHPKDRPPHARSVVDEIRLLELLAQPTVNMPSGLPTAIGREAMRSKRLGWKGWGGISAVVAAALVGLWVQYIHLSDRKPPDAGKSTEQPDGVVAADGQRDKAAAIPAGAAGQSPIKVGILHSFSGPMATSERAVADAFLLAIDEINAAGGVLGGRPIEPVLRDGKSYPDSFAAAAEKLITEDHVATIFGVWRSSCRKAVEEVCRKHDHLLVYPKADEGLEQSPYVVYMGGAPNEQTIPAVKWAYAYLGKRKFFLIGTEGLFSRASNEIIKDEVAALGATVVGEEYCGVGGTDFAPIVAKIKQSGADIVLNTVSGAGNVALFSALYAAGLKPQVMPVISYDLSEEELRMLSEKADELAGNYAAWSYFQSLPQKANQEFIEQFRKRFGPVRIVNDPMAAAYAGMHLWALGVDAAKSDEVAKIRQAMVHQQFEAPEGLVRIDPETQRAARKAGIGQIGDDLEFDVVWMSPKPIPPQVFPASRSRQAWEEFVQSLHDRWGGWSPQVLSHPPQPESPGKVTDP